jgi:hypothetical protein
LATNTASLSITVRTSSSAIGIYQNALRILIQLYRSPGEPRQLLWPHNVNLNGIPCGAGGRGTPWACPAGVAILLFP